MKTPWPPTGNRLAGFTYLELVVWGLVLTITAGLLWQLTATGTQTAARIRAHEATIRSTADAAHDLPRLLKRIRPPVWAPRSGWVTDQNGVWEIGYWDGEPDQRLVILSRDGLSLTAESPQGRWTWGPWSRVRVQPWTVDGRCVGLVVTVTWDGTTLETHWSWGSEPL